jgi:hypothetical protein
MDAWSERLASNVIGVLCQTGPSKVLRFIWRGVGYTVREDRIIAFEYFWNHAEALKAAGLEE